MIGTPFRVGIFYIYDGLAGTSFSRERFYKEAFSRGWAFSWRNTVLVPTFSSQKHLHLMVASEVEAERHSERALYIFMMVLRGRCFAGGNFLEGDAFSRVGAFSRK